MEPQPQTSEPESEAHTAHAPLDPATYGPPELQRDTAADQWKVVFVRRVTPGGSAFIKCLKIHSCSLTPDLCVVFSNLLLLFTTFVSGYHCTRVTEVNSRGTGSEFKSFPCVDLSVSSYVSWIRYDTRALCGLLPTGLTSSAFM